MTDISLEYLALKRLHESTNLAVIELQEKNMKLMEEITLLREKLINCDKALEINKNIMRNALTEQNFIKDTYSQEIDILKAENMELKIKLKGIEG